METKLKPYLKSFWKLSKGVWRKFVIFCDDLDNGTRHYIDGEPCTKKEFDEYT